MYNISGPESGKGNGWVGQVRRVGEQVMAYEYRVTMVGVRTKKVKNLRRCGKV